jgi:hypothetical protein
MDRTGLGRGNGLAVQDTGGRLSLSTGFSTLLFHQSVGHPFPPMLLSPFAIIGVNRGPMREIVRQVSPVTAVSPFIEDPVQDLSVAVFPREAPRQHSRTVRLQHFPLRFRQIGGVRSSFPLTLSKRVSL